MESLPYYDYIILCKQINPSNPERPKPLRFLHHLWGHQCTKESSEACPHERISSDTDTNTEEKKVLIWRVSLNQNLDQPSLVLLQQPLPTGVKPYQPRKRRKGKGNEKTSRKESEKKSTFIFRFLVGELSSMIRITIARKYLNRIESKPPWFQSLKFNFPVIRRNSLSSVQRVDSQGWKWVSLIDIYRWWPRTLKFNTWHYFKSTSYGEENCIQDIIQLTF